MTNDHPDDRRVLQYYEGLEPQVSRLGREESGRSLVPGTLGDFLRDREPTRKMPHPGVRTGSPRGHGSGSPQPYGQQHLREFALDRARERQRRNGEKLSCRRDDEVIPTTGATQR